MHLIDKEDCIADLAHIIQQSFDTAFKLAAELGSRYQRGHIQQVQLFSLQHCRNGTVCELLRNSFCDCSLADTRFTNQTRVIFGAAV